MIDMRLIIFGMGGSRVECQAPIVCGGYLGADGVSADHGLGSWPAQPTALAEPAPA